VCIAIVQKLVGKTRTEFFIHREAQNTDLEWLIPIVSTKDESLPRAQATALARHSAYQKEQREAARLLPRNLSEISDQVLKQIREDPRFQTRAVCEWLLSQAEPAWLENTEQATALVEAALRLADRLKAHFYGPGPLEDLRARSWALLGNIRRLQEDFSGADEAFSTAERLLVSGTGDPISKASVLYLKASLRKDQRCFTEADWLVDSCISVFRRAGETHWAGKALLKKAHFAQARFEPQMAITLLREAIEDIDFEEEPRLELVVRQNLFLCLLDVGEVDQAKALLAESRLLYEEAGDEAHLLRLPWLDALIAKSEGDLPLAERLLEKARAAFLERDSYDTWANISLDLATVLAAQKRFGEVRALAQDLFESFLQRGIPREALTSLLVLMQASRQEKATLAQIGEVSRAIKLARPGQEKPS